MKHQDFHTPPPSELTYSNVLLILSCTAPDLSFAFTGGLPPARSSVALVGNPRPNWRKLLCLVRACGQARVLESSYSKTDGSWLFQPAQVAIIKYHRLGGSNHRNLLLIVLEVRKSKTDVRTASAPREALLLAADSALVFLLRSLTQGREATDPVVRTPPSRPHLT